MAVDLGHPIWSDVAALLDRTSRFSLLALNSSAARSQMRRQLFADTTWRVPPSPHGAERALASLSMRRELRRVVIAAEWQQPLLRHLPALESVHAAAGAQGARQFRVSPRLPARVRRLRVSGFRSASLAGIARLQELQEVHLEVQTVVDAEEILRLDKLERLRLWNVSAADGQSLGEIVGRLQGLRLLEVRWSDVEVAQIAVLPRLEKLILIGTRVRSPRALMELAPRLKLLTLQLSGSLSDDVSEEDTGGFLAALTNATHLDLCATDFVSSSNLFAISTLSMLKTLHLSQPLTDISALANLSELQELFMVGTPDLDWSPIANLKSLTAVNQGSSANEWNESSMAALSVLPVLTRLMKPTKLSSAYPLVHLEVMQLEHDGTSTASLDPGCCPNVRRLWIIGGVDISTVAACFPRARGLKCSRFGQHHNINLHALASMAQLEYVHVPVCQDGYNGFSFLTPLVNLRYLDLSDLPFSDLTVIRTMTKLRALFLDGTQVEDISIIQSFARLRELQLRETPVRDVSVLRGHPQIRRLILPRDADWACLKQGDEVVLPNCIEIRQGYKTVWPLLRE